MTLTASEPEATGLFKTPEFEILSAQEERDELIFVRSDTNVKVISTRILAQVKKRGDKVILRAIGASAVNQAFKGCAHANQKVAAAGFEIVIKPGFTDIKDKSGEKVSAAVFHVKLD